MRGIARGVWCAVLLLSAPLGAQNVEGPAPDNARRVLDAAGKVVRGEVMEQNGLGAPQRVVVQIEESNAAAGVGVERGIEGAPGPGVRKDIRVYQFGSGDDAAQRELVRMQQQILRNQLELLGAVGGLARQQSVFGARSARVERGMGDVAQEMKSSAGELHKIHGEAAATNLKATDIARTTMDMAESLQEIAKNVEELEDTIKDADVNIDKMLR